MPVTEGLKGMAPGVPGNCSLTEMLKSEGPSICSIKAYAL